MCPFERGEVARIYRIVDDTIVNRNWYLGRYLLGVYLLIC